MNNPTLLIIIGLAFYVPLFYFVGFRWPRIVLLMIFAVAPFQNEVSGPLPVKFSLAEVNLLLSLPLLLLRVRSLRFGATFFPALLYIAVSLGCTLPQWRETSLTSIVQTCVYLFAAVVVFASLARKPEDYTLALRGLVVVGCFLTLAMFAYHSPKVFGLNKNGLGSSLAACFVVAFELFGRTRGRGRWLPAAAVALLGLGLLFTLSRGAWLGGLAGVIGVCALRRQFGLLLRGGIVLVPLMVVTWLLLPAESKDYATSFGRENYNIKMRYESKDYALQVFNAHPLTGLGVGLRKEYDATNLALLAMAETGVIGLASLSLLFISIFWMILRAQRGLPRDSVEFSILVIAAALTISKLVHGMVDHYWSRGSLMAAWAAVGMATYVAALQRRRRRLAWTEEPLAEEALPEPASSPEVAVSV